MTPGPPVALPGGLLPPQTPLIGASGLACAGSRTSRAHWPEGMEGALARNGLAQPGQGGSDSVLHR
eukprot:6913814-Alexandrium_andersonii.AAC.1